MKKNLILLLLAILCIAGKIDAQVIQPCGTDEMAKKYKQQHPEIATYEKKLEDDISAYLSKTDIRRFAAKTTSGTHADTDYYDIPLVMHIMHNYGPEIIPDDSVYQLVKEMNRFYSLQNDTTGVVSEFKKYVGKAKFRFHLATKDALGNPTKGITHHFTYLSAGGDDNAKMDQWPQTNYVNIWFEQRIGALIPGGIIVAYATQPPSAAAYPFSDGIICNYSFINDGETIAGPTGKSGGSIDHEMGHIFNLYHTFGHSNNPHTNTSGNCNDDDGVDDTPPTEGNLGGCHLFDSVCAFNYYKIYADIHGGDSIANYPDTSNEQNIMNYADCKSMFTKGQVERMRAALNSDVGNRNNLWDSTNLVNTGALDPVPDLPPVIDFATKINNTLAWFTCPHTNMTFGNHCWGDTISSITWTFSNGANVASTTFSTPITVKNSVINNFSQPGWINLVISATGNGTGPGHTTTDTLSRSVFVADSVGTPGDTYFQDFDNADTAKWPMFNYYNNEFKWQHSNVGMYDNNSVEYLGFDSRLNPALLIAPPTGSPLGDFDDLFSIPADLSSFGGGPCYLNYNYSGASRSSNSIDINDTLEIDYSVDHANTWVKLAQLSKEKLCNKGALSTAYTPSSPNDWAPMGVSVPAIAQKSYVVFRFRYRPGVALNTFTGVYDITDGSLYSSGNNFYIDRINFKAWPASVANVPMGNIDVVVAPNPTNGDAYVIIKDAGNTTAKVVVTDITGKTVYTTTQVMTGNETHVQIPHSAISVPGMYIVQTVTGTQATTRKFVVE